MSREEAIKILNDYDINFERNTAEEIAEAHEMAIKALETQPNEDCIRRSDASLTNLEILMSNGDYKEALKMLLDKIEKAPSVIPQPKERTEERTETHECDLEQIIKTTIKEYIDKDCDDVIELLLTLSKDLCERIKHEDEKATAAHSNAENKPRLSKPAFTVIDHVLKEHEEHEDRFTTFCDGRHQQITVKQINAELDKLYNYFYGKGEESGEGTK